jgi:sulfate transport system ATP-binding protein
LSISLKRVTKTYGDYPAIRDISLEAEPREFLALLGPSGSGKTTLLRIMAGLEFAEQGVVCFDGENITALSVAERGVGFVFQHYALFKHMTVADNIAFGLSVRKRRARPSRAAIAAKVAELLDLVQLGGLGKRYPAQLSGGQRQRVALARALAVEPRLLLLDEPFGALDAKVRKELRRWLRELHGRMGLTSIFVTHDQDEALAIADRVAVMNAGVIEQIDTPAGIYHRPGTEFVARFIGEANFLPGRVTEVNGERAVVETDDGGRVVALRERAAPVGTRVLAMVRPERVRVMRAPAGSDNCRPATVRALSFLGAVTRCQLAAGAGLLTATLHDTAEPPAPGTAVWVEWTAADCRVVLERDA